MSRIRINKPDPCNLRELFDDQDFCETAPLYQSKNGGKTTDISEALLNSDGVPVFLGYSDIRVPASFLEDVEPLTLNPAFPDKRMQAIANRDSLDKLFSQGNIYGDPLYNLQQANNAAEYVADQLDSLESKPSPSNEN